MFWIIAIVVAVVFFGWWLFSDSGSPGVQPEFTGVPLLPPDFDTRNGPGVYSAASYYASAVKWKRYDLLVAAANLPPDKWGERVDALVTFIDMREELLDQCVRTYGEKVESEPCRAIDEEIHAILGMVRQFGYARVMSADVFAALDIETSVIKWMAELLLDPPAGVVESAARVFGHHWKVCEREGRYSEPMPGHLKGCNIAGPEWKRAAEREEALLKMRRSLKRRLGLENAAASTTSANVTFPTSDPTP